MRSTCGVSRLLTAATLGYLGASPFNNGAVSWVCAATAVVGTLAWRRWIAKGGSACALRSPDARASDERETATSSTTELGERIS